MVAKMMKKMKRDPMEASASASSGIIRHESKAKFRYLSLLQDYEELLKETEAKRQELQQAKQNKLKLMAEVRFLQRKFKSLSENPSEETTYRFKKRSCIAKTPAMHVIQSNKSPILNNMPSKDIRICKGKEPSKSSSLELLELNQITLPLQDGEGMAELQLPPAARKVNKSKRFSANAGDLNDLNISSFKIVRGNKRKISWQDQVVLRV